MRNLAGVKDCDTFIEQELIRSRIEIIRGERSTGEVAASITGKLGPFTFARAWYYWIVSGLVPLAVAEELYADPVGKSDVRADGNCTCPAPDVVSTLIAPDGRIVIADTERPRYEHLFDQASRDRLAKKYIFSDDPAAAGA